jgi:hypothetical protein
MRRTLKVKFVDLCSNPHEAIEDTIKVLSRHYDVVMSDEPEVLFFTGFGTENRKYHCTKIYYTGENIRPPLFLCDFAFSHDYLESDRHHRLPHYALYRYIPKLAPKDPDAIRERWVEKSRFCTFVVSNPACQRRIDFFHKLSEYKQVDSGGRHLNNIGGPVKDKHEFVRSGKFNICFENSSFEGYTTEKLTDAMQCETVPIYWGNPLVHREFNVRSFINVHDYDNDNNVIDEIARLDKSDADLLAIMEEPWFEGNVLPEAIRPEFIADLLQRVIERGPLKRSASERVQALAYHAEKDARAFARGVRAKARALR